MKTGNYVLAIDIGNTNTVIGIFEAQPETKILYHWRIATKLEITSDELGLSLLGLISSHGFSSDNIHGLIYSSVVPSLNQTVREMARSYFPRASAKVKAVSWDMGLALEFQYPHPKEIGADRLVNASGAIALYGGDLIIVDLGTATTFCVIHDGKKYIGGCIAPGLKISMESLGKHTAQLPAIEFCRPPNGIIGSSTVEALQAGFFFSWLGILEGILKRIREAEAKRQYKVIATGGLASYIDEQLPGLFDEVDPLLTLRGLQCIYHIKNPAESTGDSP